MIPTLASITANYPHRIEASPEHCPVCCGDKRTDDKRFSGGRLYEVNEGTHNAYWISECLACDVWADRVTTIQAPRSVTGSARTSKV